MELRESTTNENVMLQLTVKTEHGQKSIAAPVKHAVIGGWTARDKASMEHHMEELEAVGVSRPNTTPVYYRVSASRITLNNSIEAIGTGSSGEVEYVLLAIDGKLYVGAGSDHTDRNAEVNGITIAKQLCDKPLANVFWPYEEVRDHWDKLIIRSYKVDGKKRELYQEGTVSSLLPPSELIGKYTNGGLLPDRTILFGGTVGAIGGIKTSKHFEFELEDPVLKRKINHAYDVNSLPIEG